MRLILTDPSEPILAKVRSILDDAVDPTCVYLDAPTSSALTAECLAGPGDVDMADGPSGTYGAFIATICTTDGRHVPLMVIRNGTDENAGQWPPGLVAVQEGDEPVAVPS